MSDKALYFIAIIPPNEVYDVIKSHQKVMSEKFDSHKSYGHIPHITLVPPFRIEEDKESDLKELVSSQKFDKITVEIEGFNYFKKHTIFAEVIENQILTSLHLALFENLNSTDWFEKKLTYFQKYSPHITVGYRDLEPNFKQAWEYFKEQKISETFLLEKVSLLKHNGEKWEVVD